MSKLRAIFKAALKIKNKEVHNSIKRSGIFNETFYFHAYHRLRSFKTGIAQYIELGHKNSQDPSPFFSTSFYLSQYEDVRTSKINPLFHYIKYGEVEGRQPNPFFNPKTYLRLNPDLKNWDKTLLAHYIEHGQYEGRQYSEPNVIEVDSRIVDYQKWILRNESIPFLDVGNKLSSFNKTPLISIVVPVYNPVEQLLIDCIDSVRRQSYQNWELCIADDKSTEIYVREVLEKYVALDSRIKVIYREVNGHISEASNSAIELAKGEWVALLDHDDLLHEHALFHVVDVLNTNTGVEFVYSDEDKINANGDRVDPHFKSDWNLDLLYSQNYVSHLGVYKRDILNKVGGFRVGYEGSQDYDLLLRYSREIDHNNIVHIPKILYHWRMIEGSTAMGAGEKSYTTDAGIKALEDHFKALNKDVTVDMGKHDNIYKVNWSIIDEPLVSLIIPTYNGYEITKQAIDSILNKSTYKNFEILLVDNNSDEQQALDYFDEIKMHEKVSVLRYPHPFNYSAINNFALEYAKGEIIGLINNDVEVINPEWLTEMVSHAQREDIGCVGAMLYFENDTIQHAGVITGIGGVAGHSHKHFRRNSHGYFSRLNIVQNLSAVTGACLLVRRSVYEEVNGLNEEDLTVAFNDVDLCLKVQKAGYRNLWTPYAELYHYESISRGTEDNPAKVKRFNNEVEYMKKNWLNELRHDRYYNPNLTMEREDFSIGERI